MRGNDLASPEVHTFLEAVKATEQQRTALSAEGSITLKRSVAKIKAHLTVAVELSDDDRSRVRLDVSTDAGNVLFALASDGRTVAILDLEHRQFAAIGVGPGDLQAIGLRAVDTRALARLLLGRTPCTSAPSGADATHIEWQPCLGGTLLATYTKTTPPYLRALALEPTNPKDGALSANLLAQTTQGFARRIELLGKDTDFLVQLDDIDPQPKLDSDLFELAPPPGVRVMTPIQ